MRFLEPIREGPPVALTTIVDVQMDGEEGVYTLQIRNDVGNPLAFMIQLRFFSLFLRVCVVCKCAFPQDVVLKKKKKKV